MDLKLIHFYWKGYILQHESITQPTNSKAYPCGLLLVCYSASSQYFSCFFYGSSHFIYLFFVFCYLKNKIRGCDKYYDLICQMTELEPNKYRLTGVHTIDKAKKNQLIECIDKALNLRETLLPCMYILIQISTTKNP